MKNKPGQRRSFLSKLLSLSFGASFLPAISQGYDQATTGKLPSLEGRKVLFVWGGWDGHEPQKFMTYYKKWLLENGATVQVESSLDIYTDSKAMSSFDLVMQVMTMSEITKEQESVLLKAIREEGLGMAGWHGGMCDAFRQNTEYQFMTGGQWVAHPGGIIDYRVEIVDDQDEVTTGLSDFKITSEQYYMHIDPNVKVLAKTKFTGEYNDWINGASMPVAWKKLYGKGRVFYSSLGHNLSHVATVPEADELMKRGIRWASASKYLPTTNLVSPAY